MKIIIIRCKSFYIDMYVKESSYRMDNVPVFYINLHRRFLTEIPTSVEAHRLHKNLALYSLTVFNDHQ